jgi:anaerobic selenocysteine-containing dehydrogenase
MCRFCDNGCGVLVELENGRPVKVRGDRDNPAYAGFCCIKGQHVPEQWNHPERVLQSQKHMPDGTFCPVSFSDAVEEIGERLSEIVAKHGPRSVALYRGTYSIVNPATVPVALAFMEAIGSPLVFDVNSIDQPGKAVAQALHGSWLAPPPAFETRDVTLLIGANPLVSFQMGLPIANPGRELNAAVACGMRVIVIDPRRTETARRAHLHLQCRPGHDLSLVAAMLNVILREELHDAEFVEENVTGLEALRAAVAPFEPELVAKRADIPVADLFEAARTFAVGRGVATAGTAPSFNGQGTLFEYLVLALNTICGQWSRAGDPVTHTGTLTAPFPAIAQAAAPRRGYGYGPQLRVRNIANCDGGLQASALAEEILLEGDGQVRALLSVAGNPALTIPDQALNVRALEALDLLVQIDIKFSATARLADYVIAPKLPLEMAGMTLSQELYSFYAAGMGYKDAYAQYTPPIVEPPEGAEVVEDWEFFYALAQRMGLRLAIEPAAAPGTTPAGGKVYLDMDSRPSTEEIFEILTRDARIPLAEVKRHPHGAIFRDESLVVTSREPGWTGCLDVANPEMLADLAEAADCFEEPEHVEADERYPYRLINGRLVRTYNSNGQDLEGLRRKWSYNPAFMHPDDLDREGLSAGDLVEIHSEHGSIRGIVQPDANLRAGVVSMAPTYGGLPDEQDERVRERGTNSGRLLRVDDGVDRYTGQPRMGNIPVSVTCPL